MLSNDGYIKLVDFGLAKINETEKGTGPGTFCGTPEYLAPEMLNRDSHDNTLDWWSLGILLYEIIIGVTPFFSSHQHKMFFLIANGPVRWPNPERHKIYVSEEAKDLVNRLLQKDKRHRIGAEGDFNEILNHPWFKNIDVKKIMAKKL